MSTTFSFDDKSKNIYHHFHSKYAAIDRSSRLSRRAISSGKKSIYIVDWIFISVTHLPFVSLLSSGVHLEQTISATESVQLPSIDKEKNRHLKLWSMDTNKMSKKSRRINYHQIYQSSSLTRKVVILNRMLMKCDIKMPKCNLFSFAGYFTSNRVCKS